MKIDRKRIATLGLGYAGNFLSGKFIDWIVDPLVAFLLNRSVGGIKGFFLTWLSLSVVSFVVCYLTLKFYDWSKTDWLGIEAVKTLKELEGSRWKRLIAWMLRRTEFFAIIGLSIIIDPFIVLIYMRRKENQYDGLSKRDWRIFLVSILISNGSEALYLYGGFEVLKRFTSIF